MAASNSSSLDHWRAFFRSSNADIFEVIERAIVVAVTDRPNDFGRQRDRIAEKLFSYRFGLKSDRRQPENQLQREEEEAKPCGEAARKADDSRRGLSTNCNFDEAEALTNEMEEESQLLGEVFRIKEVLMNEQDESEEVLFDSLRRLQLMRLSFETLGATEIGKAVSGLKKRKSKKIRRFACTLIEAWKALVHQWINATAAINDGTTPDSVVLSAADEDEGLPFPPLDEGALLAATQPAPMELSKIFDGMDEDGNPQTTKVLERNKGRKVHEKPLCPAAAALVVDRSRAHAAAPIAEKPPLPSANATNLRPPLAVRAEGLGRQRTEEASTSNMARHNRPSEPVSSRPAKLPLENKISSNPRPQIQQKRGSAAFQEKPQIDEFDPSVSARLETAKRMLYERYQQAENAKKQRTIQVMELHDLPRQASSQRHPPQHKAPQKNKLRSLLHGRR